MDQFIAHKTDESTQTLKEHLTNTANLAKGYAYKFNCGELAFTCGLLHDVGKYSNEFQKRINGISNKSVDHSTAGGKLSNSLYPVVGKLMAYCIMGHHGGIPNGGSEADIGDDTTLHGRLKRTVEEYSQYKLEIEIPKLFFPSCITPVGRGGFTIASLTKMVHSCLVDADFQDTEQFMSNLKICRGEYKTIQELNDCFFKYMNNFKKDDSPINQKRSEIFKSCLDKSSNKNGLFTLTVPTGGGKTLSSMAFSLNHAVFNNMDRIIYVIPYTSIIEQNARVFKDILGEEVILEHHSNFDFKDTQKEFDNKKKLSSENWDIPVVVTTNVQFFESFFCNKPSKCRKLHNMTNSVIILDEAQMLPTEYLKPCLHMLAELVQNYHSTIVLCSATQPAVTDYMPLGSRPIELCENTTQLYEFFKRTNIVYKDELTNEELLTELNGQNQALCIVNSRKHALELYDMLQEKDSFHLSTLMCPVHRKQALSTIKNLLLQNKPCTVVSTQLIEAGVDIDFPAVYRAMAGLDSIVQSAGRCNREGKCGISNVYVFEPEDKYIVHAPNMFKLPIAITRSIFRNYDDVTSPNAIRKYFEELYKNNGEFLDSQNIVKDFERGTNNLNFPFKDVASKFKLIAENTKSVIIPYDENAAELIEKMRYADNYKSLLRSIQGYVVNIYEHEFEKLFGAGKLEVIKNDIFILRQSNMEDCYSDKTGLTINLESGIGLYY